MIGRGHGMAPLMEAEMNDFDSNTNNRLRLPVRSMLAALILGSAILLPVAGVYADDDVQSAGRVSFVSGGVDDESLDRLKAMVPEFNLKMVFALNSGAFLTDVNVAIVDARGNPVLQTKSEGPWLLAKLPPGSYQVIATEGGNSITRNIAIGGGKLSTLDFRWVSE
jgi:hypothetical protein